jgi:hypothetical protein
LKKFSSTRYSQIVFYLLACLRATHRQVGPSPPTPGHARANLSPTEIRGGFFGNTVIDNHSAVFALHLAHMRLDQQPSIGRGPLSPSQEALHPVVADGSEKEGGQTGGRRLSEGARQIVALRVKEFVVFHTPILPQTA